MVRPQTTAKQSVDAKLTTLGLKPCCMKILTTFVIISATACSQSLFERKADRHDQRITDLTQKAIFLWLNETNHNNLNYVLDVSVGEGVPKIDQALFVRTQIIAGIDTIKGPMRSNLHIAPTTGKTYRLVIPDSLTHKYRYTDEHDTDYKHDYAIVHQFSPLLPTKERNIFFMEHYLWANGCEEGKVCIRFLARWLVKLKVEGKKITIIGNESPKNQGELWVFGYYEKYKLQEAKPGDKINEPMWDLMDRHRMRMRQHK